MAATIKQTVRQRKKRETDRQTYGIHTHKIEKYNEKCKLYDY